MLNLTSESGDVFDADNEDFNMTHYSEVQTPQDHKSPSNFDETEKQVLSFYGPDMSDSQHTPNTQHPPTFQTPTSWNAPTRSTPSSTAVGPRPSQRTRHEVPVDVVGLLQQQQGMLRTVLDQQNAMREEQQKLIEKQLEFDKKIKALEESTKQTSSGSSASDKPKTRVTRQLTVSSIFLQCI